jgi:F-type H+-transporting ATPase subunit delta
MTASSRIREISKKLLRLTLDEEGRMVEEKVREVLESLRTNPPREHKLLLQLFLDHAKRELSKGLAIVEFAGKPSDSTLESLKVELSKQYGRNIDVEMHENLDLLAGIRVKVCDDVYEDSAASRLRPLARALS